VIGVVSRLRREKGLAELVSALPRVNTSLNRPLYAVLAGDGPDKEELMAMAEGQTVPVRFVGHQDDVAPWFAVGDVIAMPSHREAFGVAAAEAMSCGRPLVASAVGGLREIVQDGETGFLVPVRDTRELADAIVRVLADPVAARRMGSAGRARFEQNFTNDAMIGSWLSCYEQVATSRAQPGALCRH
jgi:glycosyltransferase involved in cell wall biosynthesis